MVILLPYSVDVLMWLCKGSLRDYTPDIPHTRDHSHYPSLSPPGKTWLCSVCWLWQDNKLDSPHLMLSDRSWWWITTGYWGAVTWGQWRPWHWPQSELDLTTITATTTSDCWHQLTSTIWASFIRCIKLDYINQHIELTSDIFSSTLL